MRPYFARVSVEDARRVGVVIDGAIITALPNATSEFAMTVLRELGLVDTGRAEPLRRHLHGEFVVELFMEVSDE